MASTLIQLHFRLAAPSALCATERSFATNTLDYESLRSSPTASPSSTLKSPLRSPVSSTFGNGCQQSRTCTCAAVGSTVEPTVHFPPTQMKPMKPTTLYDVLGISDMVTDEEIKAAFRRIAKKVHPDQAPPEQVHEYKKKFMEAHRAYSILKDPRTRSLYNYEMRNSVYNRIQRAGDWKGSMWRGSNWETDQCWTS